MFLYFDPGSGSYLLQLAIAAVLGGLYAFRGFWARLWHGVRGTRRKDKAE